MSVSAYFVSDVHLADSNDRRYQGFIRFLRSLGRTNPCTHLFLLGDIFDLWIAHHQYFKLKFKDIIAELKRLQFEGVEIHYFEGNHDLYLKRYWQDELKIHVHASPISLDLAGKIFRLEHGDQMDPEDKGYIFLRWFLRTPLLRFVAHRLPGPLLAKIGERASKGSRSYTSEVKTQDEITAKTKMFEHLERVFPRQAFDVLVAGHLHVREDSLVDLGKGKVRLINLGSWLIETKVLHVTQTDISWVDISEFRDIPQT